MGLMFNVFVMINVMDGLNTPSSSEYGNSFVKNNKNFSEKRSNFMYEKM